MPRSALFPGSARACRALLAALGFALATPCAVASETGSPGSVARPTAENPAEEGRVGMPGFRASDPGMPRFPGNDAFNPPIDYVRPEEPETNHLWYITNIAVKLAMLGYCIRMAITTWRRRRAPSKTPPEPTNPSAPPS